MKKILSVLICILIALAPLYALGAVRMPQCRGIVTDDANVLGTQTAADLAEYAARLENETGLVLRVALVHFLDGADAQSYANALFDLWELDQHHLLIVGAAGEDRFAAAAGSEAIQKLGQSNLENLMYTSSDFSEQFKAQQYDAAFAAYCTALSALVHKQLDETVVLDGLFGQTSPVPAQQTQGFGSELWSGIMESISDSDQSYHEHHQREEREDNGLSAGGWIVLIILVMIMLRRNKYEQKKRPGCMGWLLSLLGVNLLVSFFRRKKQ